MQALLGGNTFPPYTIPLLPTAFDPSQARAPCLRVQVLCIYLPRIYGVDGRNTQQQQQARRLSQKTNLHPRSRAHECEERTIHSLIRARIGMRNKEGVRTRPSQGLILLRNGESLLSLAYPRGMVRGASLKIHAAATRATIAPLSEPPAHRRMAPRSWVIARLLQQAP